MKNVKSLYREGFFQLSLCIINLWSAVDSVAKGIFSAVYLLSSQGEQLLANSSDLITDMGTIQFGALLSQRWKNG